jgi:hypothetical protein
MWMFGPHVQAAQRSCEMANSKATLVLISELGPIQYFHERRMSQRLVDQ